MTKNRNFIVLAAVIGSLAVITPSAPAKTGGTFTMAKEARQTLKDLENTASVASGIADRMDLLSSRGNTTDAAYQLDPVMELKRDINQMGKELATMEAERQSLEPWEVQALDRVLPLLREAAGNAQGALLYLRDEPNYVWGPQYHHYAEKVKDDTHQIASLLRDYLKYQKVHEEEQHLEQTIQTGSN